MRERASRATLIGQALLAHLTGLFIVGLCGSIGTTAGFGSGVGVAIYLGGLLSLPWLAALAFVIWRWGGWLIAHIWVLYLAGPPIVWATYGLVFGPGFVSTVGISTVSANVALACIRAIAAVVSRLRGSTNSA